MTHELCPHPRHQGGVREGDVRDAHRARAEDEQWTDGNEATGKGVV